MPETSSKELYGQLNNLTDHELLLLMTQSLVRVEERIFVIEGKLDSKADKGAITALEQKSFAYDKELEKLQETIEKYKSTSHKELEDYKEARALAREVDSKELSLKIDKRFNAQDLRFLPLESFKTFLLGAFTTNGVLTAILIGLVIFIITKQ